MNTFLARIQPFAPVLLRIAMSLVFLWFSISQLTGPNAWTSIVPDWAVSLFGGNAMTAVYLNGWFELVAGLSLLLGFRVRTMAVLLALHLFGIASTFGLTSIGIRDLGLSLATLAVFVQGTDLLSIDRKLVRSRPEAEVVRM